MVLLAGFAVFAAIKWRTWFYNPEEKPYTVGTTPQWVLLTFGNNGEQSRNVSWVCGDSVCPSMLQLVDIDKCDTVNIEATGEVFQSRAGKAAYYVARLNNLNPDTRYSYRVMTNGVCSEWYDFHTYQSNRDSLSFVYIGDVQDTIGGTTNTILKEALRRNPQAEMLVCGGDLTERPTYRHWQQTFTDLDSIAQHMSVLNVTGNHDYLKGVTVSLERRFPLIFSYFLQSKMDDNMVYTVTIGNAQFFLLDSNREFWHLRTQSDWLEEQLKKSTAKWKIVVIHHPLYSIKGNNWIQRLCFNGIIQDYGVDLVLQGHEHAYARRTMKDENGTPTTPVYTISHCSPKNYLIQFDDDFDKYGISSRYYQTVSLHGDTMALATYDANTHELYDSLNIIKTGGITTIEDFGKNIKENMHYQVNPNSSKSRKFNERIEEYKRRHPERINM